MRFLLKGYAVAATFVLAIWLYGIEQTLLTSVLQFWFGGAALGLWFAWRWFLKNQTSGVEPTTSEAPLMRLKDPANRAYSVARDIAPH